LSSAMPPTSNEPGVFEDEAISEIFPDVDESLVSDYVSARDAGPGSASLALVEGDERVAQDVEQADTSLTTSPSSALVSPVLKETLLNLPPLPPDEDDDAGCGSDDSSKDDKYIFINSTGDVKSYMDLTIPTLTGMLLNNATDLCKAKTVLKEMSYEKVLHMAATDKPDELYVINTCIQVSKAFSDIKKSPHSEESMKFFSDIMNAMIGYFHTVPEKVSKLEHAANTIAAAIEEKEDKANKAIATRKRARRQTRIKSAQDDAEKSNVARRKTSAPNGSAYGVD